MKIEVIDLRKRFQEEKTEILKLIKNVYAAVYTLSGLHTVLNSVTKLS